MLELLQVQEPFTFPSNSSFIVIRHGASCLHVGNDVFAGIFEEIAARTLQTLHINLLFRRETVVDEVLGEDHEGCMFQNGSGISIGNVVQCRLHQLHESSVRDEVFQGNLWGLISRIILVVEHDSQLMLHEFRSSPSFLEDSFLVANVTKGLLLFDQFSPNLSIIVESRTGFVKEDGHPHHLGQHQTHHFRQHPEITHSSRFGRSLWATRISSLWATRKTSFLSSHYLTQPFRVWLGGWGGQKRH